MSDSSCGKPPNLNRRVESFSRLGLAEAMRHFYKLHLHEAPIDAQLISRSLEIAYRADVTIYDAIPVALATSRRARCVTADRETQYAKLRAKGYPIELI